MARQGTPWSKGDAPDLVLGEKELLSVCIEDRNVHMDQLLVLTPVARAVAEA